jgi:hypothetical protein
MGDSGEKGWIYINDSFKSIFPLFLNWLLRKLKFLKNIVEFDPPPPKCH